ncbi:GNAT family N-acetyltransferase [bacterium]|nr:GNAT family N-acetyltransferase [bacterium]MBU1991239.1 GNAT family N-acetyltransferase [bacterium]
MYNYEWDRLKTWLDQYGAIDESIQSPQEITRLDLSGNNLRSLPESIGILSHLLVLNLSNNKLNSLPEVMKNLSRLSNLDIRRNSFTQLPDILEHIPLRSLNASSNKISDISVLAQCPSLRVLDLSSNLLENIDNVFAPDNELRTLNVSSNYIKDMKNAFSSLTKIVRLNLNGNLITEIPHAIGVLGEIEELDITDNRLQTIDEAFFALDVERVDLSSNRLSSLHLHSLESLEEIILDENTFTSLSIDESFAPYLKEFSCESCGLKEFLLPASNALELLCYSCNEIQTVPDAIEKYVHLSWLDIDGNNIEDLPDSLANLSYLNTLYVNGNPLSEKSKKIIAIRNPEICDMNMKTGITIQKAKESDLSQMAELLSVLFAIETDFDIDFDKQYAGIKQLYEYEGVDLLVAKDEYIVVGMITMQRLISSAEGGFVGQIEDLVVKEEYRKMGIGSRLINKMRSIAQEYGYKRIQLAADVDNANALQFYNRRGFHKTHLSIYHYIVS